MTEKPQCKHEQFKANVIVNRIEDTVGFMADILIRCSQCDEAFRFLGALCGVDFQRPTVSIDETELRVPVEPEGEPILRLHATFVVHERPTKQ